MPAEPGVAGQPPRILHVCDSIIGGTGSYLAELLPLQAERYGAGNIMLLMPREHRGHIEPRLAASGVGFAFFRRPNRLLGMMILFFAYLKVRMGFGPTIVHAHSFGAGVVTRILRVLPRPRVVFCPHGWAFNMDVSPRTRRLIVAVERWLARGADLIVLISPHEVETAREVGIPEAKLVEVPNGIAALPPAIAPAVWGDDRIKLLFVGRFDRQKGLDVLIEAIRPLGDRFTLRVVGEPVVSGGKDPRVPLDFVDYVGWRDRNGVVAEMMACDALVIPSRWEGFGLVAIEAMRLSKPVIASTAGGLNDILDNGRYGLSFPPDDVAALRGLLETVDRPTLASFADKGHRRFADHYTADRMTAQIDDVYRRATSLDR